MKRFAVKWIACALALCMASASLACNIGDPSDGKGVVISEVATSNGKSYEDKTYGTPDWIELHNESNKPINLFGWGVTDNVKNSGKACTLPDVTIPADGYLLLLATKQEKTDALAWDGTSPICLGFSLKVAGEALVLIDPNLQAVETLEVPALSKDITYARRADGTYGYCTEPTPGRANDTPILNTLPAPAEEPTYAPVTGIEINEVSPRNTTLSCGGCESCDWIELYNTTGTDIDLTGFTLCDDPSDFDDANLKGVLPANGYLLVFCCDKDCTTKDEHLCVRLGVSRYGDDLYLYDAHGNEITRLSVPEMPQKDLTYARRDDGTYGYCASPTPGKVNTTEIAEIPPTQEAQVTDPQGEIEDPTKRAKRPTDVRISEVLPKNAYSLTDRDGDHSDWLELYNTTDHDIMLNEYYLSDNPSNLSKWAFPAGTVIPAHGYLLVFLSGKMNVKDELHASFSLGEGETLFLYCHTGRTLDWVTIPALKDNVSVGLDANNEQVYYRQPTPMGPNGHAVKDAEAIGFFPSDGVYISEVCAIHDRGSNENDWIELYNGGSSTVALDGWYLSDSLDNLFKYRISSLSIGAGSYAVIETAGSDFQRGASVAPFGINPSGEALYLSDPNGTVYDMFETGMQRNGMSSGRIEGDAQTRRVFFGKKTKGAQNSTNRYDGYTSAPTFSETALYQTETFALTLNCLNPNAQIYYTTDGSEPTDGSKRYTSPITVSKSCAIRAVAYADGLLKSEIVTYHYLFVEPHTLPVVCIAMAPEDFTAVYSVKEHKDIKERKCYVNYYESDGLIGTEFPCDIKAKGRGTLKNNKQKSLTLSLRGAYGMSHVDYPFFDDYAFTNFSAFALRQAGQDFNGARLRDAFASRACLGLNVDCANSRFCIVYVNGSYYGIYDFNEELNSKYLETHFGVDSDSVNSIMRNGSTAMKGTKDVFKKDFEMAKNADLSSDSAYQKFIQKVDPDAFIDYVICRQYLLDTDSFNQKYWRTIDYGIRWRPILYDMDFAFRSAASRNIANLYFNRGGTPSNNGSLTYFWFSCALRTNKAWSQKFVERYVELMMTQFSAQNMTALLNRMVKELEPEMERHIAKWGYPTSISKWKSEIDALRKKLEQRPQYALEHLRKEFKISTSDMNALIAKYQ